MKLTDKDKRRLHCWKEGEHCQRDTTRPNDRQHVKPMLPKVVWDIVGRLALKAKTARGQLRAAQQAIALVLAELEGTET